MNAAFGFGSLLTDRQRSQGYQIDTYDDGRFIIHKGLNHTPVRDSIIFGLATVPVIRGLITVHRFINNPNKVDDLAKGIRDWVGKDARVITNQNGDRIFLSSDGLRKARFDINNPSPHRSPHAHFEQFINGQWRPVNPNTPQIYPINVPHK